MDIPIKKGPLQLQNLDQSLAGDVVFADEAYNEYHPEGPLPERIMEGEWFLEEKVGRIVCAVDCFGFALAGCCLKCHM